MKQRIIVVFSFIFLLAGAAGADNTDVNADKNVNKPWVRKVAFGILAHDKGPISDNKEKGVDPNWRYSSILLNGGGGVGSVIPSL